MDRSTWYFGMTVALADSDRVNDLPQATQAILLRQTETGNLLQPVKFSEGPSGIETLCQQIQGEGRSANTVNLLIIPADSDYEDFCGSDDEALVENRLRHEKNTSG